MSALRDWLTWIGRGLAGEGLAREADRNRRAAGRLDRAVREMIER